MSTKYSLSSFFFLILLLAACGGEQPKQPIQPSLTLELAQTTLSVDTDSVVLSGNFKNARGAVSLQYSLNQGQPYDTAFQGQDFSLNVYGLQSGENTIVVTARDELDKTSVATAKVTYTPKPTFINATGTWSASLQNPCDALQTLEFWLTLQDTGASRVRGNFAVKMPSKIDVIGIFVGEKDKNSLTGTLSYIDSSSNEYEMALTTELISVTNAEATLSGDFLCGTAKTAISATLTFAKNLEDDTFEPNDDFLNGWPPEVPLEQELNLMMLPYDKDWFSLTLSEAKYVSFTLNKNLDFHFEGNSQFSTLREINGTYVYSGFLEPGRNMFYVGSRDKTAYTLKVNAFLAEDALYEPNETVENAATLVLPKQSKFYMERGDSDWFTFTLAQDSIVSFNIYGPDTASVYDILYKVYQDRRQLSARLTGKHGFMLHKGTYHLEVYRYVYNSADLSYTFDVTATVIPDLVLEPNDSQAQAVPLVFSEPRQAFSYTGEVGLDSDWFTFSLTKPQIVNVDLGLSEQVYYTLYKVINGNLEIVRQSRNTPNLTFALATGTYYLVTELYYDGPNVLSLAYPVGLTGQDVPDLALEPNDSSETATVMQSDKPYSLYLMPGYFLSPESDWLSFDLSKPSLITLSFDTTIRGYRVIWWRKVNGTIQKYYEPSGGPSQDNGRTIQLEPGNYYLEFMNNMGSHELSILTITAHIETLPDVDLEPNDTFVDATSVTLNYDNPNLYMHSKDVDTFVFELTEPTTMNFIIEAMSQDVSVFSSVSLYDENGNSIVRYPPPLLAPGRYFLQLVPHTGFPDSGPSRYRLQIRSE